MNIMLYLTLGFIVAVVLLSAIYELINIFKESEEEDDNEEDI